MDDYIELTERLFSAAQNVFKNLKYFYFHNCLYEGVWKNNKRRWRKDFQHSDILEPLEKNTNVFLLAMLK